MEYTANLQKFLDHVHKTVAEHIDSIDAGQEYSTKFDIAISLNGETLVVPLNADSTSRLTNFISEELKEHAELQGILDRIRKLAMLQSKMFDSNIDAPFITFESYGQEVFNPYMDSTMRFNVDPVQHYTTHFLKSDWFSVEALDRLEAWMYA